MKIIPEPFALFAPWSDRLKVACFAKSDEKFSDREAEQHFNASAGAHLDQVHSNRTIIVREQLDRGGNADGMLTDQPGLLLTCRWADCQNFILYAPEHGVIGVLHSGWPGLIANAVPQFYKALKTEWGIEPHETYLAAGPSLCQQCAEFTDPTTELPVIPEQFIDGRHADLAGYADWQLDELGVPADQRERSPICTCCTPEAYWTYRGGDREMVAQGWGNAMGCMLL